MAENRYSSGEMMSMQRDAIRRVREMQRRANEKLRQQQQPVAPVHQNSVSSNQPQHTHSAPPPISAEKFSPTLGLSSFLSNFELDQEKILLLLLIVLLLNEGADTKLVLALCYLLI